MNNYRLFGCLAVLVFALSSCGGGGSSSSKDDDKSTEKIENDLQKENLKGNVKSVRQRVYWSLEKFGRIEKGKLQNLTQHDFLKTYNENGFLVEETHYNSSDKVVSQKTISYNEKNQPIREVLYTGDNLTSVVTYTYDDKGNLTQKETVDGNDKLKERYGYTYYENGLLMDEDKYGANGQLAQKIVNVYNSKNWVGEKQYYWGGGSPYRRETFSYDTKGNITHINIEKYQNREPAYDGTIEYANYNTFNQYQFKNVYDKENEKVEINEYIYDVHGNLTSYTIQKLQTKEIEYEVIDESVEWDEDSEESATSEDIEEFIVEDNDGTEAIVVKETVSEWVSGIGAAYDYQYDEKNNWNVKITYKIDKEKARQFYYDRIIEYRE